MKWSRKLSRVLYTVDGEALNTLSDARAYAVALPENYSRRNHWQHAAKLMLEAADGGDIQAASKQVELALVLDMRLDVVRTPA
jgi:hypothetical protein